MTFEQMISILESYQRNKNKTKSMVQKIQELKMSIYTASGGGIKEVVVEGGTKKSRTDELSELIDIQNKYQEKLVKNERICYHIMEYILLLFTNNENKKEIPSSKIKKLHTCESVLLLYYINNKKMSDIGAEIGYSYDWTKHFMKIARNELYKIMRDFDFKETQEKIYG